MTLKFHEIAESTHRILNPFTQSQLELLGEICELKPGLQQLDLCCGKAEMLCRWAAAHAITGVGVDISKVFLDAAHQRITELGVSEQVRLVQGDAAEFARQQQEKFDIVSCIGATWIGGGFVGSLDLMRPALKDRASLLLVGEPFWQGNPPDAAYEALAGGDRDLFVTLPGVLDRIEQADFELIEMVLADHHGWDRYEAMHWKAVSDWLRANPDDPQAAELRQWNREQRRNYVNYGRDYLGWGIFVLRQN